MLMAIRYEEPGNAPKVRKADFRMINLVDGTAPLIGNAELWRSPITYFPKERHHNGIPIISNLR